MNTINGHSSNPLISQTRAFIVAGLLFYAASAMAQGIPKYPDGPTNIALNTWSFFDPIGWTNDNGFPPVSFTNLACSRLGDGQSLVVDTNVPAWLQYNVYESDGSTNLTVDSGSIIFWYAPDWSSADDTNGGFGPQEEGRLIEVGGYSPDSSYGWWSIYVDDGGTNLYFSAQTNDGLGDTYTLSTPIDWTTNYFHFIVLTYCSTNVAIYLDGQLATDDPGGLPVWPGTDVLSNGFYIGSNSNGIYQAEGMFNNVETFNYPLDTNDIEYFYSSERMAYIINPYNIQYMSALSSAPSSPSTGSTAIDVITGQGDLLWVANAPTCINGTNAYNAWITNVVATPSVNGISITFTIEGGSNGVPFDVFANSVLSFGTNGIPWVWEGQGYPCNTYTLSNLTTNGPCFLILGTPQDSYGAELTDAYQLLVSKTFSTNSYSDPDGLLMGWEILLGLNPNINNVAGQHATYSYTTADWLNGVSGTRSGSITLDNEGNVQSVSQ